MNKTRTIAFGVIAASLGLFVAEFSAQAKTLNEAEIPAEFPPASYQGKQYVDSRGCVYIRAGIDGLVNWVPRVTRDRQVLCGYQPTFANATPAPAATPSDSTDEVEVITPAPTVKPKPAPEPTAEPPAAKPEPTPAAEPAPRKVIAKPAPVRKATPKPVRKPRRVAATPARPAPVAAAPQGNRFYKCVTADGTPTKCGVSATAPRANLILRKPVTVIRNGKEVTVLKRVSVRQVEAGMGGVSARTHQVRVVPRHVWEQQQEMKSDAPIPEGYRAAWDDDRLNKRRAHQTIDGIHASGLTWTRTVPRRLIERSSGKDVTYRYPDLKYPYHSYAEMQAAGYTLPEAAQMEEKQRRKLFRKKAAPPALVSTKSVKPRSKAAKPSNTRTKPKVTAKARYVQIGTYSVPANADKAAARARAKGLPVRLGTLTKGGKSYRIVLAGPYAANQAGAALKRVRRAGYRDAILR
ncbi:SPOR domain-containing protein [Alisedimentitalea sp. MJ-SS2]|uniref:SPOR domain-containing protein n=1 Tax=Aliisedimentitalea sp. MJ-SS2 TaxID=3049795 RepID=UPI0029159404|nr:SPOR domain-containing protein [Alisedimentitalea sp. MJ-SS2]MDU8929890.1 SPOR domain-containing protein [Alisedimentitalea sp. MJ-SS2]